LLGLGVPTSESPAKSNGGVPKSMNDFDSLFLGSGASSSIPTINPSPAAPASSTGLDDLFDPFGSSTAPKPQVTT